MKKKIVKILSIIALVFMGIFAVLFPIWIIKPSLLGNYSSVITFISFGIAFLLFLTINFVKGFPSQQIEAEKRKKLNDEHYKELVKQQLQVKKEEGEGTGNDASSNENKESAQNTLPSEPRH